LSFFKMPKVVVRKIVAIQRKFIWGGEGERSKIAWVSWKSICKPKSHG
ncbi:hypothetical protein glysoja_027386, partial [Glycine soja]